MKSKAEESLRESNFVRAYIATVCASKLYAKGNDREETIEGLASCFLIMRQIAGKLTTDDKFQILKCCIVQSLNEMLGEFRQIPVENDAIVVTEAWCLNRIGLCYELFDKNQQALDKYIEGLLVMDKQFGVYASRYQINGHLLINSGNIYLAENNKQQAVEYMGKAIAAFAEAEDFENDEEKRTVINSHEKVLQCK